MIVDSVVKDVLVAARKWSKAREKCRRVADSKKATEKDLEKAKEALSDASDNLYKAVTRLEAYISKHPTKKEGKPIDWNKAFGTVAVIAKGVEEALKPAPGTGPIFGRVIDTTGEDV